MFHLEHFIGEPMALPVAADPYEGLGEVVSTPKKTNVQILKENEGKNFVQRILRSKDFPVRQNPDGTSSTHLMGSSEVDGKNIVYPTLVYDQNKKELFTPDDPVRHALTSGEYISFNDPEEAEKFSEGGYKEGFNYQKDPYEGLGTPITSDPYSGLGKSIAVSPEIEKKAQVIKKAKDFSYNPFQDALERGSADDDIYETWKRRQEDYENKGFIKNVAESASKITPSSAAEGLIEGVGKPFAVPLVQAGEGIADVVKGAAEGGLPGAFKAGRSTVSNISGGIDLGVTRAKDALGNFVSNRLAGSFKELPEEEKKSRFLKELNQYAGQEAIKSGGQSYGLGIGAPTDSEKVEMGSQSFVADPVSAALLGAGVASKGLSAVGKAVGAGEKAAKVGTGFKKAVGAGLETVGDVGSTIGRGAARALENPLISGGLTLAGTGNVEHALLAALSSGYLRDRRANKAAQLENIGDEVATFGRQLQGKDLDLFEQAALNAAPKQWGPNTKALGRVARDTVVGNAIGIPFILDNPNPEERANGVLAATFMSGIGSPHSRYTVQDWNNFFASSGLSKEGSRAYGRKFGTSLDLDQAHSDQMKYLDDFQKRAIETARAVGGEDLDVYVLNPEQIKRLTGSTPKGSITQTLDADGEPRKVMLLNGDTMALGHEFGHYIWDAMPQETKQAVFESFVGSVDNADQVLMDTSRNYIKKLLLTKGEATEKDFSGNELSDNASSEAKEAHAEQVKVYEGDNFANTLDEFIAEQVGRAAGNSQNIYGFVQDGLVNPRGFAQQFYDWMNPETALGFQNAPGVQQDIASLAGPTLKNVPEESNLGQSVLEPSNKWAIPVQEPPQIPQIKAPVNTDSQPFKDARQAAYKLKIPKEQVKEGSDRAAQKGLNDSESILKEILAPSQGTAQQIPPVPVSVAPKPIAVPTPEQTTVPAVRQPTLSNIRVTPEDVTPFKKPVAEAVEPVASEGIPLATDIPPGYEGLRITKSRVLPGDVTTKGEQKKPREYVRGKKIIADPSKPTPIETEIYATADTPEKQANLKAFEDLIQSNEGADIIYFSAEKMREDLAPTAKERKADLDAEKEGESDRADVQKNIVPTNIEVTGGKGSYQIMLQGYSPDKAIANAKNVITGISELTPESRKTLPEVAFTSLEQIAPTYKKYKENHSHGYRGDGGILMGKNGPLVKPDPNFTPHKLTEPEMWFMNLIDGPEANNYMDIALLNEKPIRGTGVRMNSMQKAANKDFEKAKTDRGRKSSMARYEEASQFEKLPNAELNPLRTALDKAGFKIRDSVGSGEIISSTVENLRLDRVKGIQPASVDISPGNAVFQKAGFMPSVMEETRRPAPARFLGNQDDGNGGGFPLFNLTESVPGHSQDSTVSSNTLKNLGFSAPEDYQGQFMPEGTPSKTKYQQVHDVMKAGGFNMGPVVLKQPARGNSNGSVSVSISGKNGFNQNSTLTFGTDESGKVYAIKFNGSDDPNVRSVLAAEILNRYGSGINFKKSLPEFNEMLTNLFERGSAVVETPNNGKKFSFMPSGIPRIPVPQKQMLAVPVGEEQK